MDPLAVAANVDLMAAPRPSPDLLETHELRTRGPVSLHVRKDWLDALPVEAMLDGAPITAWGEPVEHDLAGRGEVHVLGTAAGEVVAKAYSRGGFIGGLLRHWYLDAGRPAREAEVSEGLSRLGCPTPPVVAFRATRSSSGLMYRLEIATARVDGACDLLDALRAARGDVDALRALARGAGQTLRRLHDVGLHHSDLQVKNLLVPDSAPEGPFIVLDLDRCDLAQPLDRAERVASLARFARSLVKNGVLPGLGRSARPEQRHATRAFLTTYGALPDATRAALAADVATRLKRSLRTHQLLWDDPDKKTPDETSDGPAERAL